MSKKLSAVVWVLTAAAVPVLEALVTFEPTEVADWRLWGLGLGAAAVRSVSAAVLARLVREGVEG